MTTDLGAVVGVVATAASGQRAVVTVFGDVTNLLSGTAGPCPLAPPVFLSKVAGDNRVTVVGENFTVLGASRTVAGDLGAVSMGMPLRSRLGVYVGALSPKNADGMFGASCMRAGGAEAAKASTDWGPLSRRWNSLPGGDSADTLLDSSRAFMGDVNTVLGNDATRRFIAGALSTVAALDHGFEVQPTGTTDDGTSGMGNDVTLTELHSTGL